MEAYFTLNITAYVTLKFYCPLDLEDLWSCGDENVFFLFVSTFFVCLFVLVTHWVSDG